MKYYYIAFAYQKGNIISKGWVLQRSKKRLDLYSAMQEVQKVKGSMPIILNVTKISKEDYHKIKELELVEEC